MLHTQKNESQLWCNTSSMVYCRDDGGNVTIIKGTILDITAIKQSELELIRKNNYLSSLIHSHSTFLIRLSFAGEYIFVNQAYLKLFPVFRAFLLGSPKNELSI